MKTPEDKVVLKGLDQIPTEGLERVKKHILDGKPVIYDGSIRVRVENDCGGFEDHY